MMLRVVWRVELVTFMLLTASYQADMLQKVHWRSKREGSLSGQGLHHSSDQSHELMDAGSLTRSYKIVCSISRTDSPWVLSTTPQLMIVAKGDDIIIGQRRRRTCMQENSW
jgi:hypothetical protein